jgi:methionine-rich copper-binding protein CopC
MIVIRRALVATLVAGLAVLVCATPALAHAKLESTTPAAGASLATPPATVSLTFGEPVTVGADPITVTGPGGVRWAVGKVSITDSTVSAPVTATGPVGAYTLAYTVISDDGDAVGGKVAFTLTTAATPTTTAAAPTPTAAVAVATPAATTPPSPSRGGVPVWVWIVAAVVVVGGIGAAVARSRRAG